MIKELLMHRVRDFRRLDSKTKFYIFNKILKEELERKELAL